MKHKLTLQNIKNYIEGNTNMFLTQFGDKPQYFKEQISYRMLLCSNDCALKGECIVCGCKYPGRLYTIKSCNPNRFPDIMNEEDWIKFKLNNGIN